VPEQFRHVFEHEWRRLLHRHFLVRLQAGDSVFGKLQELLFRDIKGQAALRIVVNDSEGLTIDTGAFPTPQPPTTSSECLIALK
jgi:hypothetical protein